MKKSAYLFSVLLTGFLANSVAQEITLRTLLEEMTDRDAMASFPSPEYECLQASSYNRMSVPPRGSEGWFADSDGIGYIREQQNSGRREWVIMEHSGPGCLTRIWTPYFYYDLGNLRGPKIRIYLNGSENPTIEEYFIELLTRGEFENAPEKRNDLQVPIPFAGYTARAGNLYLPIPFSEHCKITLDDEPFYNIVNYRAYSGNVNVQTWTREVFEKARNQIEETAHRLLNPSDFNNGVESTLARTLAPREEARLALPEGSHAVRHLEIRLGPQSNTQRLRSTILRMECDQEETIWVPVGDFFCSGNQRNPFQTWERKVEPSGTMICRWIMPYRDSAVLTLCNLSPDTVDVELLVRTGPREWTDRSMHFQAHWRIDNPLPGTPFKDWNFIDVQGQGVYVCDTFTVLSADTGWWGEGDEKIYVDREYDDAKFPGHFGTGTEDYYGWAGGVTPTGEDVFSMPFVANVRVGNPANPRGYNICTRSRVLDAIPFKSRLRFDMEASFGVQMRNPWNLLHYSVVTCWYTLPGAAHNRLPQPEWATKTAMTVEELDAFQEQIRRP